MMQTLPYYLLGGAHRLVTNNHFYEILETKVENINKSKVRGEHKLAAYERYALPSMRYHLSVHDMHKSHLEGLDSLTKKFVKIWLNYPTRGGTNVDMFHPYLLNIKQPSQVYHEGHTSNLALMTLKGDKTVQTCLQSKLAREFKLTRKSSTIVKCNNVTLAHIVSFCPVLLEQGRFT